MDTEHSNGCFQGESHVGILMFLSVRLSNIHTG